MSRGVPSWAHPGVIIGVDGRPDARGHGAYWLDKLGPTHWQWIGVNPLHGTYHHNAAWATPVGELPPLGEVATRRHALFLLWGRPSLRAGDPLTDTDVTLVDEVLADLARHPEFRLDPVDTRRVPVLDVLWRAQHGGVHSWISARHGDLLHTRPDIPLADIRSRLADPAHLPRWANTEGITWSRPATHLPVPAEVTG